LVPGPVTSAAGAAPTTAVAWPVPVVVAVVVTAVVVAAVAAAVVVVATVVVAAVAVVVVVVQRLADGPPETALEIPRSVEGVVHEILRGTDDIAQGMTERCTGTTTGHVTQPFLN
jgi:Flp pilus assembly protein TadB